MAANWIMTNDAVICGGELLTRVMLMIDVIMIDMFVCHLILFASISGVALILVPVDMKTMYI